ncbi:MAG: cytochrome c [Deltaproteobacteria bacterium]|nr:cytochrome c [Deltaproteobacteria bacterium]
MRMQIFLRLSLLHGFLVIACFSTPAAAHDPSGHAGHPAPADEAAMKAQHERMGRFHAAAATLSDAIIRSDVKAASEGALQLHESLEGHEKDVPHKNRARSKEFHGLYVELGKRTEKMTAAIRASDLPKAAAAYGQVLSVCAACHKKFRD